MNREIKFKAWNTAIKDWLLPRDNWWVSPNGEPYIYGITKNMIPSPPEQTIFMQFTGLKDKNGKEIYEGDVVKRDLDGDVGKVEMDEGVFTMSGDYQLPLFQKTVEIIDNIYENSELLS